MRDDDVTGDPERLIQFVKRCAAEFGLTGRWGFQYANTCSRPRLDGFGGGAMSSISPPARPWTGSTPMAGSPRPSPAREDRYEHPSHARTNFQTLLRGGRRQSALMECLDAVTGTPRYVICAVGRDDGDYVFTPFGHLADGNPYDAYLPPDPDDPEGFVRPETGEAP